MKIISLKPISESWEKVCEIRWEEAEFQAIKMAIKPQIKIAGAECGINMSSEQIQSAFETIHSLPISFGDIVIKGTSSSIAFYKKTRESNVEVKIEAK